MATKITKRVVDGLKPADKDYFVWDEELSDFGVRVKPTGIVSYVLRYRMDGRRWQYSIGQHGLPWTPDAARKEATLLLGRVKQGENIQTLKLKARQDKTSRVILTVKDLADKFKQEHFVHLKPRTAVEYRKIIDNRILPVLGALDVTEVTAAEISSFHFDLHKTPRQANHALAILSKMFSLAEQWGFRPQRTNPCELVKRNKEQPRKRFLTPEELKRLGKVLAEAEKDGTVSPLGVAAIRLLLFTGARHSEIVELRWEWVDLKRAQINLPDSKTGAKTLFLEGPALALLKSLHKQRDTENPYVFPGEAPGRPLTNLQQIWAGRPALSQVRKLKGGGVKDYAVAAKEGIRDRAGIPDVRIHDLRHTHATVGVAAGLNLPIIGALLGHSQAATTQRYAHADTDPQRAGARLIVQNLAKMLEPRARKKTEQ